MKVLARLALKVLTAVSTVFIAACYGVRNAALPPRAGVVVDAQTDAPIPGILVSCLGNGGSAMDQDFTDAQGEFAMRPDCFEYRAEDVDAAANGACATKTVSFTETEPVVIRIDAIP